MNIIRDVFHALYYYALRGGITSQHISKLIKPPLSSR